MSEGTTAFIMITVVVGGYAAYRLYKKSDKSDDKSDKSDKTRTGVAALTRGYYTGACSSEFTAPDPRHSLAPYAGFYAGARSGSRHFHERMPHERPDDAGGSDGNGGGGDGGGGGGDGRNFRHHQHHQPRQPHQPFMHGHRR